MTAKPEGPAQECPVCLETPCSHFHNAAPATPAPSQPAGAREWLKETRDWDGHGRGYIRKSDGRLELLDDTLEAYAREQTAAKDVELNAKRELIQQQQTAAFSMGLELTIRDGRPMAVNARAEAAERERDSLRVENANLRRAGDSLQEEFMAFVQHTPEYKAERAAPFFTRCTNPDCEEGSVENGRCPSCDGTGWNRIPFEQVANNLYLASRRGFDAFKVELLAALKAGKRDV